MKVLVLWILLLCGAISTFSQATSLAVKFDEFEVDHTESYYHPFKEITNIQRIERLVKRVKSERSKKKVFIIWYRARMTSSSDQYKAERWARESKFRLLRDSALKDGDVVVSNGGYRENAEIEYWIASPNSDGPDPSPHFKPAEAILCNDLSVQYDVKRYNDQKEIAFEATVRPSSIFDYEWTVSAGKVVEGQGESRIRVELSESEPRRITAYVKVKGLANGCPDNAFTTADIKMQPLLIDRFGILQDSDLSARIDNFMINLHADPVSRGYVVIYSDRNSPGGTYRKGVAHINKIRAFRRYGTEKITIIDGGYRETVSTDMWILPPGVEPPVPTPSVDNDYVVVPRKKRAVRK